MDLSILEENIGYNFKEKGLLVTALTHTSYSNEKFKKDGHIRSNERLEFVGDSVIGLIVAEYLYCLHRDWPEGELSKVRASVVCEESLAKLAESLGVPEFLRLGVGENQTNGRSKASILSDAMESIVAAIFFDSDFITAKQIILPFFVELIDTTSINVVTHDFKTRLQEIVAKYRVAPSYEIVNEEGPSHEKVFTAKASVELDGLLYSAEGVGPSKQGAEQAAAGKLIEFIKEI